MKDVEHLTPNRSPALAPVAPDPPGEGVSMFPASMVQRQFWLLHQLAPNSPAYNIAHAFRLRGRLDASALEQSLRDLVARYDVFRTTFTTQGEQLVQVVSGRGSLEVATVDLTGEAGVRESTVQALVDAEAVRPFDLSRGPLLRALLLRLPGAGTGARDHHAPHHHGSAGVPSVLPGAGAAVRGLYGRGLVSRGRPRCSQYAEYAVWEQQWLGSEEFSSMLSYWEQQLRGQEGLLALPTDRPRPAVQSFAGAELPVDLSRRGAGGSPGVGPPGRASRCS